MGDLESRPEKAQRSRAVLSLAPMYDLLQRVLGGPRARRRFVGEYVRPQPSARVLDVGCGTAALLEYMPGVAYVGFDPSPRYVESATQRFGDRGRFFVGDIDTVEWEHLGDFDVVLAQGVLHHVPDDTAERLLERARAALRGGGRLVTIDPGFVASQPRVARALIARDRGEHVRSRDDYERLAKTVFGRVDVRVRHDLLRVPYTHVIMQCAPDE